MGRTRRPRQDAAPSSSFFCASGLLLALVVLLLLRAEPSGAFSPRLVTPTRSRRWEDPSFLPATKRSIHRRLPQTPSMMLCGSRLLVHRIQSQGRSPPLGAAAAGGGEASGGSGTGKELAGGGGGPSSPLPKKGSNGRRNRPPVLSKLSAILARFRTFIRCVCVRRMAWHGLCGRRRMQAV